MSHVSPLLQIPQEFLDCVQKYTPGSTGKYIAQLLWQRGMGNCEQLLGFLNPDEYHPTSPSAFGQEMKMALKRLQKAREEGEKVTIWGDFDADGITATSVLWEGLGQFFAPHLQLTYYIPNRFTESHGLNIPGIERLASTGTQLIVTCDTGSTNLEEIEYAHKLGIDVIITDHHTLPPERPQVVAIINPRYFAQTHPLYSLSGVAVAYKLVEGLYQALPQYPQQPLEELLDLVAIGLIADLVELKGDCRYLAQQGIKQLQKQTQFPTRPGVARLLQLCKRTGDRPTDISFGLGPRINAVSRIHGDASFCVELLTSRDKKRCHQLALETELANTRRKGLQKNVTEQVKRKLEQLDLSTTAVIILEDTQWQGGVLGLVAGQIAQDYGRPTILLNLDEEMARGSARSVNDIDLYELVYSQRHLLHRFGGHPFAAGLSLPIENLPLFKEAINQQLKQKITIGGIGETAIAVDLQVTVAELGKDLFRELKLVEPCGMGNPVPKLLIQNCYFSQVWHNNQQDSRGRKVQYIKTTFEIEDDSSSQGFPGVWWGHYKDEIPVDRPCDAIVELDYNTYHQRYEVRLIALQSKEENLVVNSPCLQPNFILDYRSQSLDPDEILPSWIILNNCPMSWDEIQKSWRYGYSRTEEEINPNRTLALTYPLPNNPSPQMIWQQLVGMAKYLNRTQKKATLTQIQEKLKVSAPTLSLGLDALKKVGFVLNLEDGDLQVKFKAEIATAMDNAVSLFLNAIEEEQFRHQYFYQVPLTVISEQLSVNSYQ